MPLRIRRLQQFIFPNTNGVTSINPGLPVTATSGGDILPIMNSNGVPARVGSLDKMGMIRPHPEARTKLWFGS